MVNWKVYLLMSQLRTGKGYIQFLAIQKEYLSQLHCMKIEVNRYMMNTFGKFDRDTNRKLFGNLTRENTDGLCQVINVKVKCYGRLNLPTNLMTLYIVKS